MGQLQYPQKKEIKGPWLIDSDALEELDLVVSKVKELLRKSWIQKIENDIHKDYQDLSEEDFQNKLDEKMNDSWYSRSSEKCELISFDETKLVDVSIKGLLTDSAMNSFNPKVLNVVITFGQINENKFELRVSNIYDGELKYEIESFNSQIKDDIQYQIDRWIDKRKPSRILQIWSEYGSFSVVFIWIPFVIFLNMITTYETYESVLKDESKVYLNKELILQMQIKQLN